MTTETNLQDAGGQPADGHRITGKALPILIVVNALLVIGLVILYVMYFSPKQHSGDQQEQLAQIEDRLSESVSSIAYVSSDILMEEYELAKKLRNDFEEEQARLETDLNRRQRTLQTEVEGFQRSINLGTISLDRAQVREQELMVMQQELIQLNDTYRQRLAAREFDMNLELLDRISGFLERYNKEVGHDFILGYSRGGGILHAEKRHDITEEVLRRLNEEYRASL